MGLDQYIFKYNDKEKYDRVAEEKGKYHDKYVAAINEVNNEINRRFKKESKDFKKFLKLLIDENENLDSYSDINEGSERKFFDVLLHTNNDKLTDKEKIEKIDIELFNYFPIITTVKIRSFEKENKFREKIATKVFNFLKEIKIDLKLKEKIRHVYDLVEKYFELEDELEKLEEEIYYWRKANMIHGWFKKNVKFINDSDIQSFEFGCEVIEKFKNDLKEIINLFKKYKTRNEFKINENDSIYKKIMEIMPPTEGFFFGSTDIDEWYLRTIEETYGFFSSFKCNENDTFYYYASY